MPSDVNSPGRRLENIQSVQPYIEALKTISLSKWKTSINRRERLNKYIEELEIDAQIIRKVAEKKVEQSPSGQTIVLIGTDQGFCGNLNRKILNFFTENVLEDSLDNENLFVIGEKLIKIFKENGFSLQAFPEIGRDEIKNISIFERFIQEKVNSKQNSLEILSYNYLSAGRGQLGSRRIIPLTSIQQGAMLETRDYIIDTDVHDLLNYITRRFETLSFYREYLASITYENSLRYQIMENASSNAEDLIDELQIEVQASRRQKITSEIRELAISAGLLKRGK